MLPFSLPAFRSYGLVASLEEAERLVTDYVASLAERPWAKVTARYALVAGAPGVAAGGVVELRRRVDSSFRADLIHIPRTRQVLSGNQRHLRLQ